MKEQPVRLAVRVVTDRNTDNVKTITPDTSQTWVVIITIGILPHLKHIIRPTMRNHVKSSKHIEGTKDKIHLMTPELYLYSMYLGCRKISVWKPEAQV